MNFAPIELSAEDTAFHAEARAFFDEHCGADVIEHERRTGDGISLSLHRALGERGWIVPRWSPEEGGAGLSELRAWLLELEVYRHHAPYQVMGSHFLVLHAIRQFGTPELRRDVLPAAARGQLLMTLGYTEPEAGSDIAAVRTRADRDGDAWSVSGQKIFTTGAHIADYSMVLARSDRSSAKHRGLTMLLVPLRTDGVTIQGVHTISGERSNIVFYDNVSVADTNRLGEVGGGWTVSSSALAEEHGVRGPDSLKLHRENAYVSHLRVLHDAAYVWACDPATDERPIDDPLVMRTLGELSLSLEVARLADGPAARILAAEHLVHSARAVLEMVGAAGLVDADDPAATLAAVAGEMHLFAQGTTIYGGTTEVHRNLIAEHELRLPRSR